MRYELSDLQKLVKEFEEDLQTRVENENDYATQVAVAWVLTSVFVRFLSELKREFRTQDGA